MTSKCDSHLERVGPTIFIMANSIEAERVNYEINNDLEFKTPQGIFVNIKIF